MAPLRTGLIGFGLAGRVFHAPLIDSNQDFVLTHIVTSNDARQSQARRSYPTATIVASADDLWSVAADLDLIVIASPPTAHLGQVVRALELGCAVVVDKPFALSTGDAERMVSVAEQTGRPLAVFQNRRWDGDFLTVRSLLEGGRLGQVHTFVSAFERAWALEPRHWRSAGSSEGAGILFDIGAHLIDQALELFGDIDDVTAELRMIDRLSGSDDSAFVSMSHLSGVRSHLSMSRVAGLGAPRFQVLGSEGAFRIDGIDGQEDSLSRGVRPGDSGYGTSAKSNWGTLKVGETASRVPTMTGDYPAFYAGVAASLILRQPSPVPAQGTLRALQIIEGIYRTVPIQQWVS